MADKIRLDFRSIEELSKSDSKRKFYPAFTYLQHQILLLPSHCSSQISSNKQFQSSNFHDSKSLSNTSSMNQDLTNYRQATSQIDWCMYFKRIVHDNFQKFKQPPFTESINLSLNDSDISEDSHHNTLKLKRKRKIFSDSELKVLDENFRRFKGYPTKNALEHLTEKLNVDGRTIKTWFQNKRAKTRKSTRKSTPTEKKTKILNG